MNDQDFAQANRAFELMPLHERERVLDEFARLRDPRSRDRFYEAVYRTIRAINTEAVVAAAKASGLA